MKLYIHVMGENHDQDYDVNKQEITVVLPYHSTWEQAVDKIDSYLPSAARHDQTIYAFSYMDGDKCIIVHDSESYAHLQHFSRNNGNEVQVEEHKVQSSAAEKASKYDVSTSEEEGEESGAAEKKIQKKSEGFVFLFRQFVRYPYEK